MQKAVVRAPAARISLSSTTRTRAAPRRALCTMASATPFFEIAVKGDPATKTLGDCPFSHRALLTLEEKRIPYKLALIDLDNKPQWLLDANPSGGVPVLKDMATGAYTPDSGAIADLLEDAFPTPPLGKASDCPTVGSAVLGAFKNFAEAEDNATAAEKETALRACLDELEAYLQEKGGPFIGGVTPCAADCSLMPKLYHMTVVMDHFRGWKLPEQYKAVQRYMDTFMARDSWKNTLYAPEIVISGWTRHGLKVRK